MNKLIFLLILLFLNLIKSKTVTNATKKSRNNSLRKLWDENMPSLPNRPSEEDDSLKIGFVGIENVVVLMLLINIQIKFLFGGYPLYVLLELSLVVLPDL